MAGHRKVGQIFSGEIPIRVGILGVLGGVVLLLLLVYVLLPVYHDSEVFLALALTAAATIGGTFYLAETIREEAEQEKTNRAFELIARWNSPDMFHARTSWHKITETFQEKVAGGADGVKSLLLSPDQLIANHNVRYLLNFFEEIALAVRHHHADEPLLKSFFGSIIARGDEALKTWIPEHRRFTGRSDIWCEFDWLSEKWHKESRKGLPDGAS
jgi:Domain of unknown function (DUF4760)